MGWGLYDDIFRWPDQEKRNKNEFFSPIDLISGNEVQINGWVFLILECDEFT